VVGTTICKTIRSGHPRFESTQFGSEIFSVVAPFRSFRSASLRLNMTPNRMPTAPASTRSRFWDFRAPSHRDTRSSATTRKPSGSAQLFDDRWTAATGQTQLEPGTWAEPTRNEWVHRGVFRQSIPKQATAFETRPTIEALMELVEMSRRPGRRQPQPNADKAGDDAMHRLLKAAALVIRGRGGNHLAQCVAGPEINCTTAKTTS